MLRNCTSERYEVNKGRMVRLAEYSRDALRELRATTGIAYDERSPGHAAAVPHPEAARRRSAPTSRCWSSFGVPYEMLDRDGCVRAEPALAMVRDKIAGGLRLPGDETGDCFKFTARLATMADGIGRHVPLQHDNPAASSPRAAVSPA